MIDDRKEVSPEYRRTPQLSHFYFATPAHSLLFRSKRFPAKALLAVSRRGIRKVQGLSKDQKDSAFDPLRLLKVFGHAIEGNVFHPFLVLITKH